ncbi:hypothetical protein GQ53DRAFT_819779 [Thozetella sp. PMI_491]|nr:hypothetical protein GQ53DRAFT_819779 [Thozetella sp. PMI_491]
MKVTALYVYPIKALRGVALDSAELGPQGVRYDRRFMLFEVSDDGVLKKIQLSSHTRAALFGQEIQGDRVVVRYLPPPGGEDPQLGSASVDDLHAKTLEVPLEPDTKALEPIHVNLHGSPTGAYRMGKPYDDWFSARFGHPTQLVYLGDGQRPVLGTMSPSAVGKQPSPAEPQSWWAFLLSFIPLLPYLLLLLQKKFARDPQWITFTDCAPLLVTSESSLKDVTARLSDGLMMDMYKFRPNIVVDGEGEEAFAEDFWAELTTGGRDTAAAVAAEKSTRLMLTSNCVRCTSLNVDYQTGRQAAGELGTVLKKLMKDRRVDKGAKWNPVFGRYAFLLPHSAITHVKVGEEIEVTRRNSQRTVWDWPGL